MALILSACFLEKKFAEKKLFERCYKKGKIRIFLELPSCLPAKVMEDDFIWEEAERFSLCFTHSAAVSCLLCARITGGRRVASAIFSFFSLNLIVSAGVVLRTSIKLTLNVICPLCNMTAFSTEAKRDLVQAPQPNVRFN